MRKVTIFFAVMLFSFTQLVCAQFTITNSLKTNDITGLKIGDDATLTGATGVDPNGSGWLRLTSAAANKKGYLYVKQDFPTTLGLIADFEYTSWRSTDDGYFGADGFSVFLFDGSVTEANFKLGGYGGSLGYATYNNPGGTTGLSGGYIGVGLDEYGNYARAQESRNGGTPDFVANAIVLRGPTSATYSQSNLYLTHAALGLQTGGINAVRARNEIDYNSISATRPTPAVFYRRVQIYLRRVGANYLVDIKWRKEGQTTFTNVLSYTIDAVTYPIPPTFKLGFAASTGGGYNFHEIRNLLLTTPGNIRVDSRSDSSSLCNDTSNNPITFKVEVTNDNAVPLNSIDVTNQIQDASGNLLDFSKFKITDLKTTGFTSSNLPTSNFTTNNISGKVGLAASTSGIITITGNYFKKAVGTNQNFKSVSTVNSTEVSDPDPTNNSASTIIFVRKCSIITNPALPSYN